MTNLDGLSQYLAMENGALTRNNTKLATENDHLLQQLETTERALHNAEREIINMQADVDAARSDYSDVKAYARWLESKVTGPIIGRPFPRAALRYMYNSDTESVTLKYNGQTWFSRDLLKWHPLIDLTTDEEDEGEEF